MKRNVLLLAALFISMVGFSQAYFEAPYLQSTKGTTSVFDLQKAFVAWSADNDLSQEKGWKQYKRWEKQVLANVDEKGNLLSTRQQYLNYLATQRMASTKGSSAWVSLNPQQIPYASDTNYIFGMGRVNCITFHPSDSSIFWVGTSNGGVWKTVDDGQNWIPIMDNAPSMRVSDIAVQKNNTDIMYVCSGDIEYLYGAQSAEGVRNFGMGLLKTVDGGANWDTTGLSFPLQDAYSGLLSKVIISEQDSSHLLAFGGSGIYKSTDAGSTWVLVNQNVIIDVEQNPLNDSVIYAATYRLIIAGGVNSKIVKSNDFGATWIDLDAGIPAETYRTELAISPSDTNVIYAISAVEAFVSLMKSTNGGNTWDTIALKDSILNIMGHYDGGYSGLFTDIGGQGWYDLALIVDPDNSNIIHSGGVNMWTSTDGGKSWVLASYWTKMLGNSIHADQHQFKYHPLTGELFVCNDGGVVKTDTIIGADFAAIIACYNSTTGMIDPGCYNLPTQWTNLSHTLHNSEHYFIGQNGKEAYDLAVGNQDNGTRLYRNQKWKFIYGGDGGKTLLNPDDTNVVYASYQRGKLARSEDGGKTFGPILTNSLTCNTFIPPIKMHPHNPDVIFAGFNNLFVSYNSGSTWSLFKLTTFDVQDFIIPEKYPDYAYVLDRRYAYSTSDAGANWDKNFLPFGSYDHKIAVDSDNPDIIYVTYTGYEDSTKVYKSMDRGDTWQNLSFNLPNIPVNDIELQKGYRSNGDTISGIYIGTDYGIYYINDSLMAANVGWQRFGTGLPNVTIYDLEINYPAQKLRAATYGRGLWEIDLEEISHGVHVSIEDVEVAYTGFKVFPNPANDILNVAFHAPEEKLLSLEIFDVSAKMIYQQEIQSSESFHAEISISDLSKGIYFVRLQTERKVYVTKLIKQ